MSNGRLLIVDDEPSVLASYANSLTDAGFEVTQASDGADAMRRIGSGQFDAIFSGLSMPKIDGLTLLRRLRIRSPELPVILMLDAPDNRAAMKGTELGALQSLVKPIAAELLAETASYAVRLWRSRHIPVMPHDYRSERPERVSVSATDAKNEFGRILERVIQGGTVVITKHDAPKAVLISVDEFDAMSRANRVKLDTLSGEFDALLARMQTPAARAGMKAAFDASPKQLGRAAVAAARKRG
jgi:prevent-host-death family protein